MSFYNGHTKQARCRRCAFKIEPMDYPEALALEHLREQHPDVLDSKGDLGPGDALESYFRVFER